MDYREVLPQSTLLDGKYRIERVLGAGGFGITYEATDIGLDMAVAIKEYYPSEFALRDQTKTVRPRSERFRDTFEHLRLSFLREAQTLAQFDHPSIVRVISVFPAHGTAYMVMRYEVGPSLKAWLAQLGRAPRQAELDLILVNLLQALEIMHARDFLHRDIATDNIILREDGTPVLLDFGSSRRVLAETTGTLTGIVKQGFSPAEQYSANSRSQGPWSDIYALGATLYRCVTGTMPPESVGRTIADNLTPSKVAAIGDYRASFLEAIDWSLAVQPGDRPQSVKDWSPRLLQGTTQLPTGAIAEQAGAGSATSPASSTAAPEALSATSWSGGLRRPTWLPLRWSPPRSSALAGPAGGPPASAEHASSGQAALASAAAILWPTRRSVQLTVVAALVAAGAMTMIAISQPGAPRQPPERAIQAGIDGVRDTSAAGAAKQFLAQKETAVQRAEAERQRLALEARSQSDLEAATRRAEAERQRLGAEARRKAEQEAAAQRAEAERQRLAAEARLKAEQEAAAQRTEAERQRLAAEARLRAEQEAAAQRAEAERQRLATEARLKAEQEAAAQRAEAERQQIAAESRQRSEQEAESRRRSILLTDAARVELNKGIQTALREHNCYAGDINGFANDTSSALDGLRQHQPGVPQLLLARTTVGDAEDWSTWIASLKVPACPDPAADAKRIEEEQLKERQRQARLKQQQEEEAERQRARRRQAEREAQAQAEERRQAREEAARRNARPNSSSRSESSGGGGGSGRSSNGSGGGGGGGGAAIRVPSF